MATNITTPLVPNDARQTESRSFARYLPTIARFLLGLLFFVFGLNGLLHFLPQPPDMSPKVVAFNTGLAQSGYMFPLIMGTQLLVGILLLANRFVPLALTLIAPVIVNIILFHLFLAPATIGPGIVVTLLELYLVWSYRDAFRPMLAARATPAIK